MDDNCTLSNSWKYVSKIPIYAKKKGVLNASKQCPSNVQACPSTPFSCPSLLIAFTKTVRNTAFWRPSFPTNWPIYNIKEREEVCPWPSHVATTSRILSMRVSRILSRCVSCVFTSLGTEEKLRKKGRTKKKRRNQRKQMQETTCGKTSMIIFTAGPGTYIILLFLPSFLS